MKQKKERTKSQRQADRKYNASRPPRVTVQLESDDQAKRLDELRGEQSKNAFILKKVFS